MLLAGSTRYFVYVFFLCFHTNNTFLFFLSFQKKKDHSTVYEPKVNRIHSTGLSIKTFVCPVIRVLLAQRSVFDGLYIGLRDFFIFVSLHRRGKKTHPASPRTTHSHTHHSTAQRSHEAEFSAKTSEEEKNSNNRAARCRKSERRRQPSLHLISGDERRGGNKSFQGETSTTNPRLCAQFFFFLEFTEG